MDGIKTEIPDATMVHDLDGGGNPDRALEVSSAALAKNADINIIYGINDSSSLGGLQAWKAAGKSQDGLLTVGTGGEGLAFINAIEKEPSYRIEAAMFPEKNGYTAIDAAVKLFNNEAVPEHIVSPTAPMIGDGLEGRAGSYAGSDPRRHSGVVKTDAALLRPCARHLRG